MPQEYPLAFGLNALMAVVLVVVLVVFVPLVVIGALRHHRQAVGGYVALLILGVVLTNLGVGPFDPHAADPTAVIVVWTVLTLPIAVLPVVAYIRFERWVKVQHEQEERERAATRAARAAEGAEWLKRWGEIETTAPTLHRPPKP